MGNETYVSSIVPNLLCCTWLCLVSVLFLKHFATFFLNYFSRGIGFNNLLLVNLISGVMITGNFQEKWPVVLFLTLFVHGLAALFDKNYYWFKNTFWERAFDPNLIVYRGQSFKTKHIRFTMVILIIPNKSLFNLILNRITNNWLNIPIWHNKFHI